MVVQTQRNIISKHLYRTQLNNLDTFELLKDYFQEYSQNITNFCEGCCNQIDKVSICNCNQQLGRNTIDHQVRK